jgi:hypothetical protein
MKVQIPLLVATLALTAAGSAMASSDNGTSDNAWLQQRNESLSVAAVPAAPAPAAAASQTRNESSVPTVIGSNPADTHLESVTP